MARDTEIAELKQQIANMQVEIAELKAATPPKPAAPPPKPREHRMVTIVPSGPPQPPAEMLPSDQEFAKLQQIMLQKFPLLVPREQSMEQFTQQFVRAFRWLLIVGRMEGLASPPTRR